MTVILRDMFKATIACVVALFCIAACAGLAGCASTVTGYNAEGQPVSVKVGFGNRIQTKDYTVEPAESVVNSAERVSMYAIQTAPDAIIKAAQNRPQE